MNIIPAIGGFIVLFFAIYGGQSLVADIIGYVKRKKKEKEGKKDEKGNDLEGMDNGDNEGV